MLSAPCRGPLSIDGASPVRSAPLPDWPHFAEDEIAAAVEVMRSGRVNYWTGMQGQSFEREFAEAYGFQHALTLSSGTSALEMALRCLGIGAGDDVITSSRTFVASPSCIAICGARPVFADVDRVSQNVTAATIEAALTPKTRAIIVVHLAGWPCEMESILELARRRNLFVIEDCAQAQGATYHGRAVGSFGDVAAFSFCQDKIMSTLGEGGMLATNNARLWERAYAFRDHGRSATAEAPHEMEKGGGKGFRWLRNSVGTNARMTEVQAAVGRIQLKKVSAWLESRRRSAHAIASRLRGVSALRVPFPESGQQSAWYRLYAFVRPDKLAAGWTRDRILDAVNAEGIPCFAGSCSEVYLERAFDEVRPTERFAVARALGETSLAFLVHPTLTEADIVDTCQAVEKVMAAAVSAA